MVVNINSGPNGRHPDALNIACWRFSPFRTWCGVDLKSQTLNPNCDPSPKSSGQKAVERQEGQGREFNNFQALNPPNHRYTSVELQNGKGRAFRVKRWRKLLGLWVLYVIVMPVAGAVRIASYFLARMLELTSSARRVRGSIRWACVGAR